MGKKTRVALTRATRKMDLNKVLLFGCLLTIGGKMNFVGGLDCSSFSAIEIVNGNLSNAGKFSEQWNDTEMRAYTGNTIKIISANINSWKKHGNHVLSWKSDILALQEVRLTETTKISAKRTMENQGYQAIFGKGMRSQFITSASTKGRTTAVATQGGVAICARESTCKGLMAAGAKSPEARALYEQGRYKRGAVPIKSKGKITRYT
jgi:hypothetical protein